MLFDSYSRSKSSFVVRSLAGYSLAEGDLLTDKHLGPILAIVYRAELANSASCGFGLRK